MGRYKLYCPECKTKFDDVFTNICPVCEAKGPLIKVEYEETQIKPLTAPGFWKFLPWLPCSEWNNNFDAGTIVYKSTSLAKELELNNLYIAFNGYWPEKQAKMLTCTFKELEAPPTFQRATEKCIDNLVIASAGNTAKAFIYAAKHYDVSLYVIVPYTCKGRLVLPFPVPENVIVVTVNKESDYSDSIEFAGRMCQELSFVNEGGARNIARRDGMGTVMLESVLHMNRLPDHYFQAVGSGTGAIAAKEAVDRLISGGQYSSPMPKLHLSQNLPFTPMVNAWSRGLNKLEDLDENSHREAIAKVFAKVLTNRHPPYSVGGGIYDILKSSKGRMYPVSNDEAFAAAKLFENSEGIDLVPAACVVVASLIQAVENNFINRDDVILVNITGGGEKRLWEDFNQFNVEADLVCEDDISMEELKGKLAEVKESERD